MIEEWRLIDSWLESKGTTLWADWDISDPGQRAKAAAWFREQMDMFLMYQAMVSSIRQAERFDVV